MIRLYPSEDHRLHIDLTKAGLSIQRNHRGFMLFWSSRISLDGWHPYRQKVLKIGNLKIIRRYGPDASKLSEVEPGATRGNPEVTLTIDEIISMFEPKRRCKHCNETGKIRTIVSTQGIQSRNNRTLPIRGNVNDGKRVTVLCQCVLDQYHLWAPKNEYLNVEEAAPAENETEDWYWCRLKGKRISARACFLCLLEQGKPGIVPLGPRMTCVNLNGYRVIK